MASSLPGHVTKYDHLRGKIDIQFHQPLHQNPFVPQIRTYPPNSLYRRNPTDSNQQDPRTRRVYGSSDSGIDAYVIDQDVWFTWRGQRSSVLVREIRGWEMKLGGILQASIRDRLIQAFLEEGGSNSLEAFCAFIATHGIAEPLRLDREALIEKMIPANQTDYLFAVGGNLKGVLRNFLDTHDFIPKSASNELSITLDFKFGDWTSYPWHIKVTPVMSDPPYISFSDLKNSYEKGTLFRFKADLHRGIVQRGSPSFKARLGYDDILDYDSSKTEIMGQLVHFNQASASPTVSYAMLQDCATDPPYYSTEVHACIEVEATITRTFPAGLKHEQVLRCDIPMMF